MADVAPAEEPLQAPDSAAAQDPPAAGEDLPATADTAAAKEEPNDATDAQDASKAPQQDAPQISFKVTYGKNSADLKRPTTSTVGDLKAEVEKTLAIPPSMQKLMFRGKHVHNDGDTLEQVGIKNGAKVLLIGSSQAAIAAAAKPGSSTQESKMAWDAPKQEDDICKQPQHAKIIAKGVPEDAMPGVKDRQLPLPDSLVNFNGLYNNIGSKVRLTFKPETQQLWIASATSTQKFPYSSISKIDSYPIEGHDGYSILSLGLGAGTTSRYWLYFFPSQYVSGVKIRLIGVHALL